MLTNLAIGKAGDLRVASELLLRGCDVFLTIVDSGSDLVLGNGKRIQVKTARRHYFTQKGEYQCSRYTFSFKAWQRNEKHYKCHALENVDFVILWAVEDDVFFIIPAEKVRGKYSVSLALGRQNNSIYLAFKDKWDSLK